MSETFEEYWGQNRTGQYGRIERVIAKQAWDHQQEKLKEKDKEIERLKEGYQACHIFKRKQRKKLEIALEALEYYKKEFDVFYVASRALEKINQLDKDK